MMTLPPSSHHHHRPHPALQPAPPSSLVIATAIVRRLVREKSSYVIELAGQEARLADLLLKTKREKGEKEEGGGNEDVHDENWGYRVKQEEKALEETRAVFAPLTERILTAVEKLEDMLNFETWKDEKEVQAAKDMVATAKQHMANDLASMPDGQSQGLESCERKEGVVGRGKSISMNYDF